MNVIMDAITAVVPPVILAPPPFPRNPLQAGITNVLDLSQKDGCKYYKLTTRSLFPYEEFYDMEPEKFQTFIDLLFTCCYDLRDVCQQHEWHDTDRIPSTNPGAEPPRDARDSGSARSHSTHLETSSSDRL